MELNTKHIKLSEFRDSFFAGDQKPTIQTLKNHIRNQWLSGKKIGGQYYVIVTGWGQPVNYAKPEPQPIVSTGNALADKILKRVAA